MQPNDSPSGGVTATVASDAQGKQTADGYKNRADCLFRSIGALVTPQNPPPNLPG